MLKPGVPMVKIKVPRPAVLLAAFMAAALSPWLTAGAELRYGGAVWVYGVAWLACAVIGVLFAHIIERAVKRFGRRGYRP
jgi:hypothetical protein